MDGAIAGACETQADAVDVGEITALAVECCELSFFAQVVSGVTSAVLLPAVGNRGVVGGGNCVQVQT